ncbi:MAG TPA: efflux RND transporter periplasmic adaptor subunit [Xanthomonadales bacterium]|nr:efflux RND transporter periplasmic adaptor subunit [Xanthomonadales bacterium]
MKIALPAMLALLLAACGSDPPAPARGGGPGGGKPVAVTIATVEPKPWVDTIEALGTAKANESVTITAKVTETVERVEFEDGDFVEAGEVLVDLSGRAELAGLEEARAAFKEAQQQLDRQSELVKQGTIARSQLDTQVGLRDAARARMDAIRARLSDRVITAPFAGVLGFRQVSPGGLVTPGTAIATLDDVSTIKLDFSVPETLLSSLKTGQQISATSATFPGRSFQGTVTSIDSRVDPVTRAVIVRAAIPNPDSAIRPGMLMSVKLFEPERSTLVIPELALTQVGSKAYVFRVKDDSSVEQVEISPGDRRRGEVEVVAGLAAGDRIVVEGTVKLRPGAKVTEVAGQPAAERTAASGQ